MSGNRTLDTLPIHDADLRTLADAVPHSVWVISTPGMISYANSRAEQYAAAGTPWVSILHPDDVAAAEPRSAIGEPQPYEVECRLVRADGSFRRHRVALAPVGDGGAVGRWIATGTDVEETEVLRDERERAQAFRSVIMNDMADGLFTVDGDGRLTSINRAASEMLGWREDELLGRTAHSTMHAAHANGARRPEGEECVIRRLRKAGQSAQGVDEVFTRNDGSTFEVTCSIAPLDAVDGKPGAVITFRDMTEVRRAELELRHAQKLESLGRLSAGLAHEINTPIQFVGDNTRFLADACRDLLDLLRTYRECMATELGDVQWDERIKRAQEAEVKADVDYLTDEIPAAVSQSLEGVERVATLVRAMKSFSHKGSAAPARADLNDAVRTTLTIARNEVKYVADVILELGELPDVLCHLGDLNQVFLNLLVNAADAVAEKGGRGEIRISSALDGSTAVISFADNGTGIPEDVQPSIFEPFFTTKDVGKGSGQGLPLACAVMQKHGGSIEMSSTPGQGTVFTLRLPIDGKPA